MKHRNLILASCCLLFALHQAKSQVYNQSSLLWRITGNGLSKPSYLYGTLHAIEKKDYFLTPATKAAFVECKVLATEQASVVRFHSKEDWNRIGELKYLPHKKTLAEYLAPEVYDSLVYYMHKLRVNRKDHLRLKPYYLGKLLYSKQDPTPVKIIGYEEVFWEWAIRRRTTPTPMAVMGLEELKQTLNALDSLDIQQQVNELLSEMRSPSLIGRQITDYYKAQDIVKIYQLSLNNEAEYRILVKNRNLSWLDNIERLLHTQPTFIAVGAAHLAGEYGLIQLLSQAGYEVTPMHVNTY